MPENTNNYLDFQLLLDASYLFVAMIGANSKIRYIKLIIYIMCYIVHTIYNIAYSI